MSIDASRANISEEAAWRGEMTSELRHIHIALREVQRDVQDLRVYVCDELRGHLAYHAAHESRWGPVRWCEQHPFRLALLAVCVCMAVTMHHAHADWANILAAMARWR